MNNKNGLKTLLKSANTGEMSKVGFDSKRGQEPDMLDVQSRVCCQFEKQIALLWGIAHVYS